MKDTKIYCPCCCKEKINIPQGKYICENCNTRFLIFSDYKTKIVKISFKTFIIILNRVSYHLLPTLFAIFIPLIFGGFKSLSTIATFYLIAMPLSAIFPFYWKGVSHGVMDLFIKKDIYTVTLSDKVLIKSIKVNLGISVIVFLLSIFVKVLY